LFGAVRERRSGYRWGERGETGKRGALVEGPGKKGRVGRGAAWVREREKKRSH